MMSLRKKLALLIAVAVAVAVGPYAYYSATNFAKNSLAGERANFEMLGALVNDNLNAYYYNYLTGQMADIMRHKDQLRKISIILSRNWSNMDVVEKTLRDRLIGHQARDLRELGLLIAVLDQEGEPVRPFDAGAFALDLARMSDFAGRPLASGLDLSKLPADGRFSVYHLRAADGGGEDTYLGLLMPDAFDRHIVVCMIKVNHMQSQMLASTAGIIDDLERRLADIQLSPGSGVSLVDSEGHTLVRRGIQSAALIPPDLYTRARRQFKVEEMADVAWPGGRALIRLEYFKPLDWFVVMTVAEETITGPARTLGLKMALAGGLVALVSIIISLAAGNMLIQPLLVLNKKTLDAAELDLNSPEADDFFSRGLPTGRKDEIGQLASSFSAMGLALAANVRQLVAGTASRVRLEAELSAARDIQLGMLPDPQAAPSGPEFELSAYLNPAKEVGGDLYDFFTAPCGRRALVIGDVSDKGVPAALFMAMTSTLVRQAIGAGLAPAAAMKQVNDRLAERNPSSMFVTLFIGLFDPRTGCLEYANAGHCFPLVCGPSAAGRFLEGKSGPMAGIFNGLEYAGFSSVIEKGELCFLYTDGVTEAQDEGGGFFGAERLAASLAAPRGPRPAEAVEAVLERVLEFQGAAPQADDITILAFTGAGRADR